MVLLNEIFCSLFEFIILIGKHMSRFFFLCMSCVLCAYNLSNAMENMSQKVSPNVSEGNAVVKIDSIFYHTKSDSFEKFIRWSDEKSKIAAAILSVVNQKRESLLDIGAGDGSLTRLIEAQFDHIAAVEPGVRVFDQLSATCSTNKYTLVHAPFEETRLEGPFDIIIASYSFRYISNSFVQLCRIRDLLKDSGAFILIDVAPKSDFWEFYLKHEKDVIGINKANPDEYDYSGILKKIFNVQEVHFNSTLSMPSVDDALSILDFLYDIEMNQIKEETFVKLKSDWLKEYGNGPINVTWNHIMYICTKQHS